MSDCRFVDRHVGAFVDGELDPSTMVMLDRHVDACADCQERLAFERTSRAYVRECLGGACAPPALRRRVSLALATEPAVPGRASYRWRVVGGAAGTGFAAFVALFVVFAQTSPQGALSFATLGFGASAHSGIEEVVRLHSSALPADVGAAEPQEVGRYFSGRVAFPVRPTVFDRRDVRFVGARFASVQSRSAAALYYDVGGARVTVVVYESPDMDPVGVERVRMGSREVFVDTVHGRAVPMRRVGGMVYVFTGDLDRREMLELAAGARVSP